MLPTNEELGITQAEREALRKVQDVLSRAVHVPDSDNRPDMDAPVMFHMAITCDKHSCGTVACVGGWVYVMLQGIKPNEKGIYEFDSYQAGQYVRAVGYENTKRTPLRSLYYPQGLSNDNWDFITPQAAITAIDRFLETGEPGYAELIGKGVAP